ncbi:MAG: TonB-dependent receptor [Candidatus Aminicenantes bacterium]|nr:TonB-dependent receptor [Candidatus Aminicenantes bacterium]
MRKPVWTAALILFASVLFLFPSEDQKTEAQKTSEHHEVIVTATRLETPAREIGSSVSIISAFDLSLFKRTFILETLRDVPAISSSQNGGMGGASSVFVRGANSEHTLVLLDGVELNDPINPSRSADLAHLLLANVERIEVLRGSQSPLYGSDALGGVVNIISKRGEGRPRLTLTSSGGSFGTINGQAAVSGAAKSVDYSFGLSRYKTSGISAADSGLAGNSELDGYTNWTLSGRLGIALRKNLELDFIAHSIWAETDIDNFGGPYGDDPNNTQDYRSLYLKGQARGLFLKNRWEQKLAVAVVDSRRSHHNRPDEGHPGEAEEGHFAGRMFTLDWQNNIFLHPAHTMTAGLIYEKEQGESEYLSESLWGPYSSLFPLRKAETIGLYLQDSLRVAGRFFATAGLRYDRHSRTGAAVTYRLAPAYIIESSQTKIRASLGTGFKSPSLYQLYAPGTVFGPIGNDNLRPERSLGWDAGVEQSLFKGKARAALTYFHNDFENLIDFSTSAGYINIGKAETKGVEVEFDLRPWENVTFSLVYTRLEARDKTGDTRLLRRPEDTLSARFAFSFLTRWTAAVSIDHVGRREDMNYSSWPALSVTLPAYSLLSAVVSFEAGRNLQPFIRLDNILNARYVQVYGYGSPRFSIQGGVRLSL